MSKELKIKGALSKDYQQIYIEDSPTNLFINEDGRIKTKSIKDDVSDGSLTISSVGHLTLDTDGDITLDAASGNIYCKDNGGNYTPGSDYEIATKKYVDDNAGGGSTFRYLINGGFNYSSSAGTKVYVPLNGSLAELSYTGTTEYVSFLAPFDGSLTQVIFRSEEACGSTVVGLHKSSTGTEFPNTTAAVTVTVDMTTDDTPYKFAFSTSNTFSAGDVLAISFDPTNDANDTIFTAEFTLDSSSGL